MVSSPLMLVYTPKYACIHFESGPWICCKLTSVVHVVVSGFKHPQANSRFEHVQHNMPQPHNVQKRVLACSSALRRGTADVEIKVHKNPEL